MIFPMHVYLVQSSSPLMVAGFMILAFSTLGAVALSAWLYSRFDDMNKKIKRLAKETRNVASE